jgi:PKD repeat protein
VQDAPVAIQAFALVGATGSVVPGPVASFDQPGDPGAPQTYVATIAWGDRSTGHGRVAADGLSGFFVNAAHAYARPGSYTITVRVTSAAGASAVSTNRVTVFSAKVCPKGSSEHGHNCLGDIQLAPGCVFAGPKLHVTIPRDAGVVSIRYSVDRRPTSFRGRGPRFAAAVPTAGLRSGTHRLTARITFRTGMPRTLLKTRPFAVC